MKLKQIRDVVAIADRGSLRAAAQHLRLALPALTRSVRELERELGIDLFERHARGMPLTPLRKWYVFVERGGRLQGLLLLYRSCRLMLGHLEWWHAAQSTPMSVTNYQLAPHRHRLRVNRMKLSQCVN
jgi:hypothetical protein